MKFFRKSIGLITCLVFMHSAGFAQTADEVNVNYSKIENHTPNVILLENQMAESFNFWEEKFKGHWAGIHMGFNCLSNTDYSDYPDEVNGFLDNETWKSNSINFNPLQISIGFQHNRNTIGLVTGVGLEISTYTLDKNISIEKTYSSVEPTYLFYDDNQKSKLSLSYIDVPLMVEFQIPMKEYGRQIFIAAGAIAKFKFNAHTKIKYKQDNQKLKLKTPDDFHIRNLSYAATVRIGYGSFKFFATYDLQPLFEDDKGPILYPFSVGLTLISF